MSDTSASFNTEHIPPIVMIWITSATHSGALWGTHVIPSWMELLMAPNVMRTSGASVENVCTWNIILSPLMEAGPFGVPGPTAPEPVELVCRVQSGSAAIPCQSMAGSTV